MNFKTLALVALFAATTVACGDDQPVLVGLWSGETVACSDESLDGADVRISVVNGPDRELASFSSTLALPEMTATACTLGNAAVDGYGQEAMFDVVNDCDGGQRAFTVDVGIPMGQRDLLLGDVEFEGGSCSVQLDRVIQ